MNWIGTTASVKFQFERHGKLVADCFVHVQDDPVFNLAVGLKDSWEEQ